MAMRRVSRSNSDYSLKKHCRLCSRPREKGETFSRRGMCDDCAVSNMVAYALGLSHVYYTIEEINSALVWSYRGPVQKVA